MYKDSRWIMALIFAAALALRLFFTFVYSSVPVADELDYGRLAGSLLSGKGYVSESGKLTAGRPPGYPVFLAGIYSVFGRDNLLAVRVIQSFIDSVLCVFVFLLGSRVFNRRAGLIAGLLAVMNLSFIARASKLLTESVSAVLLLAAVYLLHSAVTGRSGKKLMYAGIGALLGVASLIRANNLMIFVFILFYLILHWRVTRAGWKRAGANAAVYCLAFLIPILPWTIRNYAVFHDIIPVSTLQGMALYASYNPREGRIYGFTPQDSVVEKARGIESEAESSRFLSRETARILRNKPWKFFTLIPLKLAFFFSPLDWGFINGRVVYNYSYAFYLPFFIAAFFIFRNSPAGIWCIYMPVIVSVFSAIMLFGLPRFRMPVEPYMIILAAGSIAHIYERTARKRLFGSCAVVLFLLNVSLAAGSGQVKFAIRWLMARAGLWL